MKNPAHSCRDYTTVIQASAVDCRSVLEPGAQFGWNLQKIPANPKLGSIRKVGVEVHRPYVDDVRCVKAGIEWVVEDARAYLAKCADESFDLVLLMDFIEHFDRDDAIAIVQQAKRIAGKRILWWCPIGDHPQDYDEWNLGGAHWQTHRSTWTAEDMTALGFDTALWKNHHGPKNAKGQPHSRDAAFGLWVRGI